MNTLFAGPFSTVNEAKSEVCQDLFQPYGIFEETPGIYHVGRIREQEAVPVETAVGVFRLTGYRLILHTDPVMCNWKAYMGPYEVQAK